ncbi:MAG: hypothetical protein RSE91_00875 [Bacilli bacterium]
MEKKKLAYLNIKIHNCSDVFNETYTFLKPTVLYLPHNLILNIKTITCDKICIILTRSCQNNFRKEIILSLCDKTKKIVITDECHKITICLSLCQITKLIPHCKCYNPCCHPCNDDFSCNDDEDDFCN